MSYSTRLLCPWDSPGQDTGVSCHALLQGIFPPRGRTRISFISYIGRRVFFSFFPFFTTSTTWVQMVKCLPTMWETRVQSLVWEGLLEKEMATHSSILAWRIPRMEEPHRLQSMELQSQLTDFTFTFHLGCP